MAASMGQPGPGNMFLCAVDQILKSWPALHLAVEQGFGGPESREKADWMATALDTWFKENDRLYADEVEDFLNEVLNSEFDLRIEDGSVVEIAGQLCLFFQLCQANNINEIQNRLQALPKPNVRGVQQVTDDDMEEMESDEESSPANSSTTQHSGNVHGRSHTGPSSSEVAEEMEADQEEADDGWKVIRKGKKKK